MVAIDEIDDFDYELPAVETAPITDRNKGKGKAAANNPRASFLPGFNSAPAPPAEELKTWATIYPIYIDAKRSKSSGGRRVSKELAVQWPLARNMAVIAHDLGFAVHIEGLKRHPADWENPGRLRVRMKDSSGKPLNPRISSKLALIKLIAKRHNDAQDPPIHEKYPPNSPFLAHGILQHAIENPSAMMPPGMEGLMGGPTPDDAATIENTPTPAVAQTSAKSKGKKKVVVVRR